MYKRKIIKTETENQHLSNERLNNIEQAPSKKPKIKKKKKIIETSVDGTCQVAEQKTIVDNRDDSINSSVEDIDSQPSKKQKNKNKNKMIKTSLDDTQQDAEQKDLDDNEDDSINSSKKPKSQEKSKRQIKKEKAEIRNALANESSKTEAAKNALNYVSKWKHARDQWKFEKLKQVWLIENIFQEKYIPDQQFQIVIEYFENCKGMARQKLISDAMSIVKKAEDNDELLESVEYKRARLLVQSLSTDLQNVT